MNTRTDFVGPHRTPGFRKECRAFVVLGDPKAICQGSPDQRRVGGSAHVPDVNPKGLEVELVDPAAALVVGLVVPVIAASQQLPDEVKGRHNPLVVDRVRRHGLLGDRQLTTNAILLDLEVGQVQRIGEVGVLESGLGLPQTGDALALALDLVRLTFASRLKLGLDSGHESGSPLRLWLDGDVILPDGGLDVSDLEVRQVAANVGATAAGAEEVEVVTAVALGHGEDETAATAATDDASLQVVAVAVVPLSGDVVGLENGFDSLEPFEWHQWLVMARTLDTLERRDADVVAVSQHPGDLGLGQWLGHVPTTGQRPQAPVVEGFGELGEAPIAG